MSKYLQVFKLAWQRNFEYRANAVGHLLLGLISLIVPLFIFKYAFAQGAKFGTYDYSALFTYLIMTKFMHFAGRGNITRKVAAEIKDGSFSNYLLKPIGYQRYWLAYTLSDRLFEICLRILMLLAFLLLFPTQINLSTNTIPFFLLTIPISLALNYFFGLIIAHVAFFITDIKIFATSLGIVIGFLAGEVIPIDLLPGSIGQMAAWLPFRFASYFPIMVYQGKVSANEFWLSCFSALVWISVFAVITNKMWQKGVKHYEAIGR